MIQIGYKLTEQELYQSLVATSKSRFITKLFQVVGSIILAVMVFIITVNLNNGIYYISLGFVFPVFLGIYFIFLPEITAKFQVPNLIKKKNPFTEEIKVKIYETGFRVKGESFTNQYAWDKLNSIIETKDFFLLKDTEINATVLPKRAFTTEDISEFKQILGGVSGPKLKLI